MDRRTWTNKDLTLAVKTSFTLAEVIRKLGLSVRPGNYSTVKKYVQQLNLDTSHFTGKSHGTTVPTNKKSNEEVFVRDSSYNRQHLKTRIIKQKLIEYVCDKCGLNDIWNDTKLVLVLDHINGMNNDNRLENLRFLCPNCNSQTSTFCRKNN